VESSYIEKHVVYIIGIIYLINYSNGAPVDVVFYLRFLVTWFNEILESVHFPGMFNFLNKLKVSEI
jgi:hypothetical protein